LIENTYDPYTLLIHMIYTDYQFVWSYKFPNTLKFKLYGDILVLTTTTTSMVKVGEDTTNNNGEDEHKNEEGETRDPTKGARKQKHERERMGVGRGWWFLILSEGQFHQFTLIVGCRRNSTDAGGKSQSINSCFIQHKTGNAHERINSYVNY